MELNAYERPLDSSLGHACTLFTNLSSHRNNYSFYTEHLNQLCFPLSIYICIYINIYIYICTLEHNTNDELRLLNPRQHP